VKVLVVGLAVNQAVLRPLQEQEPEGMVVQVVVPVLLEVAPVEQTLWLEQWEGLVSFLSRVVVEVEEGQILLVAMEATMEALVD
jgi:hypothetical protein